MDLGRRDMVAFGGAAPLHAARLALVEEADGQRDQGAGLLLGDGAARAPPPEQARAGAELAVAIGVVMMICGPLWAKGAWGH